MLKKNKNYTLNLNEDKFIMFQKYFTEINKIYNKVFFFIIVVLNLLDVDF